uniref:Uncharacterized protein n=1 Tax=Spermophilus dauricus TaxID=99837 RepID=A0A8C9UUP3_SPEDA
MVVQNTCSPTTQETEAGKLKPGKFLFGGIKKYFNTYTCTGRMICVQATYRGNALMILYFKLRSKNFHL